MSYPYNPYTAPGYPPNMQYTHQPPQHTTVYVQHPPRHHHHSHTSVTYVQQQPPVYVQQQQPVYVQQQRPVYVQPPTHQVTI